MLICFCDRSIFKYFNILYIISAGLHIANVLGEDGLPGNLGEFKYKLDQEYPDLYVKRGGWIKAVNQDHLPILKLVGMSAVKVGLEKG